MSSDKLVRKSLVKLSEHLECVRWPCCIMLKNCQGVHYGWHRAVRCKLGKLFSMNPTLDEDRVYASPGSACKAPRKRFSWDRFGDKVSTSGDLRCVADSNLCGGCTGNIMFEAISYSQAWSTGGEQHFCCPVNDRVWLTHYEHLHRTSNTLTSRGPHCFPIKQVQTPIPTSSDLTAEPLIEAAEAAGHDPQLWPVDRDKVGVGNNQRHTAIGPPGTSF